MSVLSALGFFAICKHSIRLFKSQLFFLLGHDGLSRPALRVWALFMLSSITSMSKWIDLKSNGIHRNSSIPQSCISKMNFNFKMSKEFECKDKSRFRLLMSKMSLSRLVFQREDHLRIYCNTKCQFASHKLLLYYLMFVIVSSNVQFKIFTN